MSKRSPISDIEILGVARKLSEARGAIKSLVKIHGMKPGKDQNWRRQMLDYNKSVLVSFLQGSEHDIRLMKRYAEDIII